MDSLLLSPAHYLVYRLAAPCNIIVSVVYGLFAFCLLSCSYPCFHLPYPLMCITFLHSLPADRMQVINNVLTKVKARATEKAEAPVKATHSARHRPAKSYNQDMLQTARARVNYERAVRLAEAEMVKLEFKEELEGDDKTAKAQALATVALHTPGSLLTTSELVHIQSELNAACRDNLPISNCNPDDRFRTFDGTCNNLANPIQGAFRTPLRRILPQRFEDGIQQPRGAFQARDADILGRGPFQAPNPSSRLVVSTIHQSVPIDDPVHSHMLMQFGQFLDHDFAVTPEFPDANCDEDECSFSEECLPIRVSSNDPVFGAGPNDPERCLFFARSLPVCDRTGEIGVRNVFNDITSYIDASMVYGSEPARARFLREFRGGRLRVGPAALRNGQPSLPTMSEAEAQQVDLFTFCARGGCFAAGDPRPNEQVRLREGGREGGRKGGTLQLYVLFYLLLLLSWSAAWSNHDTHHLHEGTQPCGYSIGQHQPTVG